MELKYSLPCLKNLIFVHTQIQQTITHTHTHTNIFLLDTLLILSYNLRIGFQSGLLPSPFPTKTLYALLTHVCYMPCPSRPHYYIHTDLGECPALTFENHLLSAVNDCLFCIFKVSLRYRRPPPPQAISCARKLLLK